MVGIETRYRLDGPAIESRIEFPRIHLGRPWGPPSLLYKGYRVISGVKRLGSGVDHPPRSSAKVKARVDLCTYNPPLGLRGPSGVNFTFTFTLNLSPWRLCCRIETSRRCNKAKHRDKYCVHWWYDFRRLRQFATSNFKLRHVC